MFVFLKNSCSTYVLLVKKLRQGFTEFIRFFFDQRQEQHFFRLLTGEICPKVRNQIMLTRSISAQTHPITKIGLAQNDGLLPVIYHSLSLG